MSAEHTPPNAPAPLDLPAIAARCWAIADLLTTEASLPPAPLKHELASRERGLIVLRDATIARLRIATPGDDTAQTHAALAAINAALSILFGLEYPGGPLDRTLLTRAAAVLWEVGGPVGSSQ